MTPLNHGTVYTYNKHGCRCEFCKKARAEYGQDLKKRRKPMSSDDPRHGTWSGYQWGCRCEDCRLARLLYKRQHPGNYNPTVNRRTKLKQYYQMTPDQYDELLENQNGHCAICPRTPEEERWKYLSVDHDHGCCPGEKSCGLCIRGLLCNECNFGLAKFRDQQDLLLNAVNYLRTNSRT